MIVNKDVGFRDGVLTINNLRHSVSELAPGIGVDPVPVEGSTAAVMSGGVYSALQTKLNRDGIYVNGENLNFT